MKIVLTATITGLLFSIICHADADAQNIAFNCLNCHTNTVNGITIPHLKKLSSTQLRQMLLDFKYDNNPATLMPRIAKGYSDRELSAVADYLAQP